MTWCVDAASENFVKLQSKGQQFHPPPAYILALQTIHFITSCLMWKGLFGWKILDFEILPCPPPHKSPPPKNYSSYIIGTGAALFHKNAESATASSSDDEARGAIRGACFPPKNPPPLENVRATHFATVIHTVLLCQATCTYILIRSFRLKHPR